MKKALQKILAVSLLLLISWSSSAQKFRPSFFSKDAIGIIGGYHFQKHRNKIELGISRVVSPNGFGQAGVGISTEFGKVDNADIYGLTASIWISAGLAMGLATTYSADFNKAKALSFRPMIGLGLGGVQVVYEYDFFIIKPTYDFGARNRVAVRLNLGLFELR